MVIDSTVRSRGTGGHSGLRYVVAIVGVVAVAGIIYFGFVRYESGPKYYEPARKAVVAAQTRLAESFKYETALMEQLHMAHSELDAAIAELAKAERLDPRDKREIETLRVRLTALEDAKRLARMSPEQLQESYHNLSAQMDALILKLEQPNQ